MTDRMHWGNDQQVSVRELRVTNLDNLWSLILDLETTGSAARRIRIVCKGVVSMKLSDWPPAGGHLAALAVYDVSARQLEGIHYALVDYENGQIEVECMEVAIDR